jgi:hypothetical protein
LAVHRAAVRAKASARVAAVPIRRAVSRVLVLVAAFAAFAAAPTTSLASDTTLRASVVRAAKKVDADGRALHLAVKSRTPYLITHAASSFRTDVLIARQAIAVQTASSSRGRLARSLAIRGLTELEVAMKHELAYAEALEADDTERMVASSQRFMTHYGAGLRMVQTARQKLS